MFQNIFNVFLNKIYGNKPLTIFHAYIILETNKKHSFSKESLFLTHYWKNIAIQDLLTLRTSHSKVCKHAGDDAATPPLRLSSPWDDEWVFIPPLPVCQSLEDQNWVGYQWRWFWDPFSISKWSIQQFWNHYIFN